ncbi:MAG: hypothetical protein JSV18_03160 [Candidatus Bathyarchaeota archaeon]|nr:MAG: hypothetical protein JSV18_03160 [Candidatus Bathyarchaeota archaeon]
MRGKRFENDWTSKELEDIYSDIVQAVTVPVNVEVRAEHRVLDLARMEEILKEAKLIVLQGCGCRESRGNCDAPLETCLNLNGAGEYALKHGKHDPRRVTLDEALTALRVSHEAGLVHLAYTMEGDERPEIICSCCPCCCHTLSGLLRFGLTPVVLKSGKTAVDDEEACTSNGVCVDRCVFGARRMDNGRKSYDAERCFGCGLCVTTCAAHAIALVDKD